MTTPTNTDAVNTEAANTTSPNPTAAIRAERPSRHHYLPSPLQRHDARQGVLTIAPMAYLKLRTFLHADHVEVGGFGISAADDPLYLERFETVKQVVTAVSVKFDDGAVADHFDRCVDAGIAPARCGRVWLHSHPGDSATPSATDEETFARAFGGCDWAVMAIIARSGATYARLQFSAGPGGRVEIPVKVDWERFPRDLLELEGTLDDVMAGWMDEYGANVQPMVPVTFSTTSTDEVHHFDVFGRLYDEGELEDDFAAFFERHGDVREVD